MNIQNTRNGYFNGIENWISGITDAEGCFYIQIIGDCYSKFNLAFSFYISQKDTEFLITIKKYFEKKELETTGLNKNYQLKKGNGTTDLIVNNERSLNKVIRPFFQNFPLLSSKWIDYLLFFAAFDIWKDNNKPKHVRILNVAHLVFAMNSQGEQKKRSLAFYINQTRSHFKNVTEWENAILEAQNNVIQIKSQSFPPLSVCMVGDSISDDYFIGLFVGDGCFGVEIDYRQNRKIKVRKTVSISLKKTPQNELLLDSIAERMGTTWNKKQTAIGRHSFKIERTDDINSIFQPFFQQNIEKLPTFRRNQFNIWYEIDKLNIILSTKPIQKSESEIIQLITNIYHAHGDTYRHQTLNFTINRFKTDWEF